jgi:hypothetical protein
MCRRCSSVIAAGANSYRPRITRGDAFHLDDEIVVVGIALAKPLPDD